MSEPLHRHARELPAGTVIFREGEMGDVMYVLQAGHVRITKIMGDEERLLATLGPGEFFGEMAILNQKPRTANAIVVHEAPAKVLVLDAERFEKMIENNREVTLRLIRKLAFRLDSADALIEILLHRDPKARVMRGLARMAQQSERSTLGMHLRVNALELATQVNVAMEHVDEVLARLVRVKIVTIEPSGHIVLHELARLLDFFEFLEMPQKFLEGEG